MLPSGRVKEGREQALQYWTYGIFSEMQQLE